MESHCVYVNRAKREAENAARPLTVLPRHATRASFFVRNNYRAENENSPRSVTFVDVFTESVDYESRLRKYFLTELLTIDPPPLRSILAKVSCSSRRIYRANETVHSRVDRLCAAR